MITIKLPNGTYELDINKQLGPQGGFGTVYEGYSEIHGEVAIKEINVDAHREINIGAELLSNKYEYIIPIYDAGMDESSQINYIVMAKAEKSLQDDIYANKKIDEQKSLSILLNVVSGLLEVPQIVHRDLKPGNILFHSGVWKIADFGIARFIEETTSLQTLQAFLTPQYAAPEQWNLERPSNAVDVYSLGCIAFMLLTGSLPFTGTFEDLKEQHLHQSPPIDKIPNPSLRSLVGTMLSKTAKNRPSLGRIKDQLKHYSYSDGINSSNRVLSLASAAAKLIETNAMQEAQEQLNKSQIEERMVVAKEAQSVLSEIVVSLFQQIQNAAPNVIIENVNNRFGNYSFFPNRKIVLGEAEMIFDFTHFSYIPANSFNRSGWDIITGVIARISQNGIAPYIWSANLWFAQGKREDEYRWWEISYMAHPLMRSHPKFQPYAVENLEDADIAMAPGMANVQLGSKPKMIDGEKTYEFIDRWIDLFTKALNGELRYPSHLPID